MERIATTLGKYPLSAGAESAARAYTDAAELGRRRELVVWSEALIGKALARELHGPEGNALAEGLAEACQTLVRRYRDTTAGDDYLTVALARDVQRIVYSGDLGIKPQDVIDGTVSRYLPDTPCPPGSLGYRLGMGRRTFSEAARRAGWTRERFRDEVRREGWEDRFREACGEDWRRGDDSWLEDR